MFTALCRAVDSGTHNGKACLIIRCFIDELAQELKETRVLSIEKVKKLLTEPQTARREYPKPPLQLFADGGVKLTVNDMTVTDYYSEGCVVLKLFVFDSQDDLSRIVGRDVQLKSMTE